MFHPQSSSFIHSFIASFNQTNQLYHLEPCQPNKTAKQQTKAIILFPPDPPVRVCVLMTTPEKEKEAKECAKLLRELMKSVPASNVFSTTNIVVSPELLIKDPTIMKALQERISFYDRAKIPLMSNLNFRGEKEYTELYEDMISHPELWEELFSHREHMVIAERCTGIIGTLATLHRQRGNLAHTLEIMEVYQKTLESYSKLVQLNRDQPNFNDAKACCEALRFKYNLVKFNCLLDQYKESVESGNGPSDATNPFLKASAKYQREMIRYEIENNIDFDHQAFAFMFMVVYQKEPTMKVLSKSTDEDLIEMTMWSIRASAEQGQFPLDRTPKQAKKIALATCANCGKQEPYLNTFNQCGRCKSVRYCGKECQATHWRVHKKSCNPKNK